MNNRLMFSSETGKWDTPQFLIDDLATAFSWDLDVCASRPNVCDNYCSEIENNGLDADWDGVCWMNPPYGSGMREWMHKAYDEWCFHDSTIVCLVPARTDTRWWQDNAIHASHIVLIKGRLKFGNDASWVAKYSNKLMGMISPNTYTPFDEIMPTLKRVGGALLDDKTRLTVSARWPHEQAPNGGTFCSSPKECAEWEIATHLAKDSAPFPSAFIVFGELNTSQIAKLAEYGQLISQ